MSIMFYIYYIMSLKTRPKRREGFSTGKVLLKEGTSCLKGLKGCEHFLKSFDTWQLYWTHVLWCALITLVYRFLTVQLTVNAVNDLCIIRSDSNYAG